MVIGWETLVKTYPAGTQNALHELCLLRFENTITQHFDTKNACRIDIEDTSIFILDILPADWYNFFNKICQLSRANTKYHLSQPNVLFFSYHYGI